MKKLSLHSLVAALFCAAICASVTAQTGPTSIVVPAVANSAAEFVPVGWRLEVGTLQEVDLNADGKPDAAFVISIDTHDADTPAVTFVKHVLVLALREIDGRLHRSMVSDAAVLDGNEGGVFGDPFESLLVERGALVIMHYGGSRDRWGYTHRYRYQNGQWTLIGLTLGNTDSTDPGHFDQKDINLSTGLVEASEQGEGETPQGRKIKRSERSGSYFELEAVPVVQAPKIDGRISAGEWPGYTVRLNEKQQVARNAQLWTGADDLSTRIHAVRVGENLYLCAEVTDNEVTAGDTVRLVNNKGLTIKPGESKIEPIDKGYVFEARYSLSEIVKATRPGDEYAGEELQNAINPAAEFGDITGFKLDANVEIVDVDSTAVPKARAVLSTRLTRSPYSGSIRLFHQGTLVLVNDSGPSAAAKIAK
jgi:hypothetical protein